MSTLEQKQVRMNVGMYHSPPNSFFYWNFIEMFMILWLPRTFHIFFYEILKPYFKILIAIRAHWLAASNFTKPNCWMWINDLISALPAFISSWNLLHLKPTLRTWRKIKDIWCCAFPKSSLLHIGPVLLQKNCWGIRYNWVNASNLSLSINRNPCTFFNLRQMYGNVQLCMYNK